MGFWVGMVVLAGFAWSKGGSGQSSFLVSLFCTVTRHMLTGDPTLLTHGVDQYGFVCGTKNTYNGTVVDLTEQKYLYYLDPFALLNTSNLPWAASICVSECPSVEDLCEVTTLPCRNSTQYRCVYWLCQLRYMLNICICHMPFAEQ